jgi:hypothetical protein
MAQNFKRYGAIVGWAARRYTRDGILVIDVGGVPSRYTLIERAAWNRYMGGV